MKKPPIPPNPFAKPEKKNTLKTVLLWGFIVCGIGAIVWMIAVNPRQKTLHCDMNSPTSLTSFGNCTEE